MKKSLYLVVALLLLCGAVQAAQIVVIKADDFVQDTPGWRNYLNYMESNGYWHACGVTGNYLRTASNSFVAYLKTLTKVEYYNHAWEELWGVTGENNSCRTYGSLYTNHLLAQRVLGVTLYGYGAPGNVNPCATIAAIERMNYEYWFFPEWTVNGCDTPVGIYEVVREAGGIESVVGVPSYAAFSASYDPLAPLACFQVHPYGWTAAYQAQFELCIADLVAAGVTFTTPYKILHP